MTIENTDAGNTAGQDVADVSANVSDQGNQAQPSLDESLRATFKNMRQEEGADTGQTEGQTDAGRVRGPDGKFVKTVEQAAPDAPAEGAAKPDAAKPPEVSVNTNPDSLFRRDKEGNSYPINITKAPDTWRNEAKAVFEGLPEWARREVHKREQDVRQGIQQYQEAAGFGQSIAQELLPYQQQIQHAGVHPREVVKSLMADWKTLTTGSPQDKANLVLQLVKDYGIDFTSLGTDPQQGTAQTTQADPEVAALKRELGEIKGQLTTQERQRAEAEYSANIELVNKFGSDPKHKHYEAVRGTMAELFKSGQAKDLEDAYDKATWIVPEVRKLLLAEQEKERADKAAAEAAAARKAAGANVTRRGTPPVKPTTGSMEDTLRKRFRELNGA